jgi:hypothetical protein
MDFNDKQTWFRNDPGKQNLQALLSAGQTCHRDLIILEMPSEGLHIPSTPYVVVKFSSPLGSA